MQLAYGAAKVVQFALPGLWVGVVCRKNLRLPLTRTAGLKEGLLLGVVVVAGMLAGYFFWLKPEQILAPFASLIGSKARSFGMGSPAAFIVGAVLLSLVHSLLEEYYWRWFLFGGLRRYMPVAAAVVISALALTRPRHSVGELLRRPNAAGRFVLKLRGRRRRGLGLDLSPQRFTAGAVA